MQVILKIPTLGDDMTQSGGIIMIHSPDQMEYVVRYYSDEGGQFQGAYYHYGSLETQAEAVADAMDEVARRVRKASQYQRGGALNLGAINIGLGC